MEFGDGFPLELEDSILDQIDFGDLCTLDELLAEPTSALSPSEPQAVDGIAEIENRLMKDDDGGHGLEPPADVVEKFLADVLADSPSDASADGIPVPKGKDSSPSDNSGKVVDVDLDNNALDHADDPISKKRRRQLRNRDAALRSRERKKMYVKELEMKSRYLEAECIRLGRLLQCCFAENQALRVNLQMSNAAGASAAKQESAVLLMELLLLGSLLWLLSITCVLTPGTLLQTILLVALPENDAEERSVEYQNPGGSESKVVGTLLVESYVRTRKCKASRSKIKPFSLFIQL